MLQFFAPVLKWRKHVSFRYFLLSSHWKKGKRTYDYGVTEPWVVWMTPLIPHILSFHGENYTSQTCLGIIFSLEIHSKEYWLFIFIHSRQTVFEHEQHFKMTWEVSTEISFFFFFKTYLPNKFYMSSSKELSNQYYVFDFAWFKTTSITPFLLIEKKQGPKAPNLLKLQKKRAQTSHPGSAHNHQQGRM